MPKHRDLQSLTKLLEKTQSFEFNIKNVLPIMFTYDQFTPNTMLVLNRAFAWNTLNGCEQGSLREGVGENQLNLGGGLSGCKTIILATLVLSKISALLSHQDGLYLMSHNMVTTMGQSSWLLILADG